MNGMFDWDPAPGKPIASPYLYVFWVVTIPLTVMIYIAWFFWFRYSQKKFVQRHKEETESFELKYRIQTRETW